MIGIYKITNNINGMSYIGQSNNINRRWKEHRNKMKDRNSLLYQAMREFGIENFSFEIIEECSLENLNDKEKFYINKFDTLNNGYNMNIMDNMQYKINWDIAKEIQNLLKNLDLSMKDIAEKYNVSYTLISLMNQGKMWYNKEISYPIRAIQDNSKRIWKCCNCGKEISRGSKRCSICKSLFYRTVKRPNREELKQLIRNKSFAEIAKHYGVSDNAIRKWCDFEKLPRKKREIDSYSDDEWNKI